MRAVLRPINDKTPLKPTAEGLRDLVGFENVRPLLRRFLPGVIDRYCTTNDGIPALERVVANREITAYLLLLVQGRLMPTDIPTREYPNVRAWGIGVEYSPASSRPHERLIGMASQIGGQSLQGLVNWCQPSTWRHGSGWTNLGIWYDPLLSPDIGLNIANNFVTRSPDDSFVTVEPKQTILGRSFSDPAAVFVQTDQFIELDAKPRDMPMTVAHGIASPKEAKTLVRKTSKAAR